MKLGNLVADRWLDGRGSGKTLSSAVTGEPVATLSSDGIDFAAMLEHARQFGGANLHPRPR